jgi:hypothetical protein
MPPNVTASTQPPEQPQAASAKVGRAYLLRWFSSFADLPAPYRRLLDGEIKRMGLFREPEWFEHLMQNFFDEQDELRLYGLEEAESGRPLLLAPLRYTTTDTAIRKGHVIASISNPENYTTAALILDPSAERPVSILEALFRHFRKADPNGSPRRFDAVRIWPLEVDSSLGNSVHQALRRAGFVVQP